MVGVANCLLLRQQSQASVTFQPSKRPLHVRNPSNMEPLYATVQRKQRPRNTPEDRQQNSLEAYYGGKTISNSAAFIIQRAFRAFRLRKQFSKLLSIALTEERSSESSESEEINVDTGLPIKAESPVQPDNLDLLILQAAGLETFSSIGMVLDNMEIVIIKFLEAYSCVPRPL